MQYRLTKTQVNGYTEVPLGMSVVGDLKIYDVESNTFIEDCTIDDIKIGRRISVFGSITHFIATSNIVQTNKLSDETAEFKTTTSTYRLEVL